MPVNFNSQLGAIVFGKNLSHVIESHVPLHLSKEDNNSKLLEAALMNNQKVHWEKTYYQWRVIGYLKRKEFMDLCH